jgi:hypothetical protein
MTVQLPSHTNYIENQKKHEKRRHVSKLKYLILNNSFKSRAVEQLYPLVAMELTTGI